MFRPTHRKKRDPYARQILGVYKAPEPNCVVPDCVHPWARHDPEEPHRCRVPDCCCFRYRRGEQR